MFKFSLRTFVALFITLSVSSVYAQNKVVVIPLFGDDIGECELSTVCENGIASLICPGGVTDIPCEARKKVFVTSGSYQGDLGGADGAHSICQGLAEGASWFSNGEIYKAWISTSTFSPINDFTSSAAGYVRATAQNTVIARSFHILTSGILQRNINRDEAGEFVTDDVWTNTGPDGSPNSETRSCVDFTSASSEEQARIGDTDDEEFGWTSDFTRSCDRLARLYCFEQ